MSHRLVEAATEAITMAKLMRENERMRNTIYVLTMQLQNTLILLENEQALSDGIMDGYERMRHAVCGDSGFAESVRMVSGIAYPWPALDVSDLDYHKHRAAYRKARGM